MNPQIGDYYLDNSESFGKIIIKVKSILSKYVVEAEVIESTDPNDPVGTVGNFEISSMDKVNWVKPHIHRDLAIRYFNNPNIKIEIDIWGNNGWTDCVVPDFNPAYQYREKPVAVNPVKIDDIVIVVNSDYNYNNIHKVIVTEIINDQNFNGLVLKVFSGYQYDIGQIDTFNNADINNEYYN